MTRFWQVVAVSAVAVAAFMGGSTLSWGHGGDASAVHACTSGVGQPITLSSATGTCGPTGTGLPQTPLDWTIQGSKGDKGEKGDQGPQGPAGDQGATGPQGSPGTSPTSVYQIVAADVTSTFGGPGGVFRSATAICPKGFQVVNGGFSSDISVAPKVPVEAILVSSRPTKTSGVQRTAWSITVYYPSGYQGPASPTAYALCVGPGPVRAPAS